MRVLYKINMNQSHYQLVSSKEEFLGLLIKNVGEGKFTEGQFEEVADEQESQEDFGFQEEEEHNRQQKQLYRKSIVLGPEKKPPINHVPPALTIKKYLFAFGCNPGTHTTTLVEGKICRGIGVNIFFEGQIYSGHNYEVTYLSYDCNKKILISGTQGKTPQLRLWKVIKGEDNVCMEPNGPPKLNLPMSSMGVGFAWLTGNDCLAVIARYTLHSNSQLYFFDLKTNKRTACQCKLGKVVNLVNIFPPTILNSEGISEITYLSDTSCKLVTVSQESEATCCQFTQDKTILIVGYLTGTLKVSKLPTKQSLKSSSVHLKGVRCVCAISDSRFLSAGNDKKIVLHQLDSEFTKITKIQQIQLSSICLQILPKQKAVFCLLKNTDLVQVSIGDECMKLALNPLSASMVYSENHSLHMKASFVYNKYSKKYLYSLNDTPQVCLMGFDGAAQLTSAKKYEITDQPRHLDTYGTLVFYVRDQDSDPYKSTFQSHISTVKNQTKGNQILIIEDFTTHKTVGLFKLSADLRCTAMRINPEGEKLALGFNTGLIQIYYVGQTENVSLIKSSSSHNSEITNLIWSKDSRLIKSFSLNNLVYLDVLKDKEKMTPIYTAKPIRQSQFPSCGKFDWKTFALWEGHLNLPQDITDVKETSDYLLACMANGALKVYRNPASKESQELIRLFNKPFLCEIIKEQELHFTAVIAGNGAIFGLEIGEDFSEEDQNSSFQSIEGQ